MKGPVEYVNITLDDDRVLPCVQSGLFLIKRGDESLAILVSGPMREFHPRAQVSVEVMARSRDVAEGLLADFRTLVFTAMTNCAFSPCPFDENPPHRLGSGREEMSAAVPVLSLVDIDQPDVRFVNQGRRLERLPRASYGPQHTAPGACC